MNNIAFKTSLIKGATGTGVDKTIPEDGVIYYDGDSAPEGYTQTTDPTGGGGGGSYEETILYAGEGVYTGMLTLSHSISNYNALIFNIDGGQQVRTYIYCPASAFSVNDESASIGCAYQSADIWFQFKRISDTSLQILNNSGTSHKLYQIIGVKY